MTLKRRGATNVALGLVLAAGFFGFMATRAHALSISDTYTDIAFGSAGTGGQVVGLQPGLAGPNLVNGFPTGTLGNNFGPVSQGSGISADGVGTRVDNASGLTDPASTAPEPATLVLFGTTLVGIGAVIRRHLKGGKKVA